MSTRSGKRIHSSLQEHQAATIISEKKTRKKRFQEDEISLDLTLPKAKQRKNYVSYPTEDDTSTNGSTEVKSARKIKRYTLKEHNTNGPEVENQELNVSAKKIVRVTRQTKKFAENFEENPIGIENNVPSKANLSAVKKGKKNKKRKSKASDINDNHTAADEANEEIKKVSATSKKKKKGKHSKTSQEPKVKKALNAANSSTDTFYSATDNSQENTPLNEKTLQQNDSFVKSSNKKKKSIKKTPEHQEVDNLTFGNNLLDDVTLTPSDFKEKRKSVINTMEHNNTAVCKQLDSEFDEMESVKQNTIVEREPKNRRSLRSSHIIVENNDSNKEPLNSTFEKMSSEKVDNNVMINLDSTFDKSEPKMNSTFDKIESKVDSGKSSLIIFVEGTIHLTNEPKVDSGKSSLITSDEGTVNLTYDKDDDSRISITSDESRTENIVNATPVLIESSMDESHLSTSKHLDVTITKENDVSPTSAEKDTLQVPVTPLKREGTFTKENSEVVVADRTPNKTSLPSPGCTPFYTARVSQKSVLNVTRSIEKDRRSSVDELLPRQTKVMFCSPMNNSLQVTQEKRKIIKSSIKGSNKSFVYDEKELPVKPAARKRSYTHNDADDRHTKRKRLADDLQQSVDRLSRPRTSSASAKLTDTPSKKAPTPSKPKPAIQRTKIPDFSALHKKAFAKMESLDECVDRKAKRARQLLTPNGGINVLERNSPKITEPVISEESQKRTKPKEAQKTEAKPEVTQEPEKPETSKLPTLESLRPGYTRFGFKMNIDVNPFSIPSKKDNTTEKKPKKPERPSRLHKSTVSARKTSMPPTADKLLPRQPTAPSQTGATTSRKEAAKQTVLREKSFSSIRGKRDVTRIETRTVIKGVRTNRQFELLMKMRNID